jgi:hypothetical protein
MQNAQVGQIQPVREVRLPPGSEEQEDQKALDALSNSGHEDEMRAALAEAVAGLFAVELPEPRALDDLERTWLASLARLTVRARSAVERDRQSREIELPPTAEGPARMVKMLARLLGGLDAIGLEREVSLALVAKVALDSLPALRRSVLHCLAGLGDGEDLTTTRVAEALNLPTNTVRRGLQDLHAHGLVDCRPAAKQGEAHSWSLRAWTRERLHLATLPAKSPEAAK